MNYAEFVFMYNNKDVDMAISKPFYIYSSSSKMAYSCNHTSEEHCILQK